MNGRLRLPRAAALAAILLLFASCPNAFMKAVQAKVASDQAKVISVFGFTAAANAKLYKDVAASIDATSHTLTLMVPKWVPLTNLVATFQFQGAAVTVNGAAQTSGVTPNDFSSPVKYRVTPASGTPVVYTVTATTGSQGLMGGVIQGTPLNLSGTVTTVAGAASPFGDPEGLVQLGSTIYVADARFNVIWQVDVNTHAVSVFAGTLNQPGSTNGAGTNAQFNTPMGLATDGANLYVADELSNEIRQVAISGAAVTTLAGSGTATSTDGVGAGATFDAPIGLYYDSASQLLFEADNKTGKIRTITPAGASSPGTVTTIATSTSDFPSPQELCTWIWNSNNYLDSTVSNGTTYFYEVSAVTASGVSFASIQQSATPYTAATGVPAGLSVSAGSAKVTLAWSAVSGATNYNLYWSTTPGVTTATGTKISGITGSTYSHTGRTNGTPYYYIVTSVTGVTESSASAQQEAIPQAAIAGAPIGLVAAPGINQTTLSWTAVSGATGYFVYRSTSYGSAGQAISPIYLYVTDGGNNKVYQCLLWSGYPVTPPSIASVTIAPFDPGRPPYNSPRGIAAYGNLLFVADSGNNSIQKIDPSASGSGVLYAGSGTTVSTGTGHVDGFNGQAMLFNSPNHILVQNGTMYVAESGNLDLRAITPIGTTNSTSDKSSTLAGIWPDSANGNGSSARFHTPHNLTTNGETLWIVDLNNDLVRSMGLSSPYPVATVAGQLGVSNEMNGIGTAAAFSKIGCTTTDGKSIYITDETGYTIRRLNIATGNVDTIAGVPGSSGYNDGPGAQALFGDPKGITTDGTNLYVVDTYYNSIRMINLSSNFQVSTIAGPGVTGTTGSDIDSPSGPGTSATFNVPLQLTTDGKNLYVTCGSNGNESIRQISLTPPYAVTTLAGPNSTVSGTRFGYVNGPAASARFFNPTGIVTDGTNLYVSDFDNHVIRQINISNGNVTTLAGAIAPLIAHGEIDGTGAAARFNSPNGISTDGTSLYVTDQGSHVIRMIR